MTDRFDEILNHMSEKEYQQNMRKPRISGKSCLDCSRCDVSKINEYGMVYCKWDYEYYYPETGPCDRFQ